MKMYIYDVDSNVVVATVSAENNIACEKAATEQGYEQDELGWAYNDNGLEYTTETVEVTREKKYYATTKHHSQVGYWEKLSAGSLHGAKVEATKRFKGDLQGSVLHLCKVENDRDLEMINDLPALKKTVGYSNAKWEGDLQG
ncbi:MAG: hypothetical protein GY797_02345 [Deltaproteobacteria bacterium]|nr:hypothetical protein [Deltaproteobacteria bacterium]